VEPLIESDVLWAPTPVYLKINEIKISPILKGFKERFKGNEITKNG